MNILKQARNSQSGFPDDASIRSTWAGTVLLRNGIGRDTVIPIYQEHPSAGAISYCLVNTIIVKSAALRLTSWVKRFGSFVAMYQSVGVGRRSLRRVKPKTRGTADLHVAVT